MNIYKKMSMILMAFSSSLYVITTSAVSRHAEESSQQSARELQRSRHTNDYLLMTPRQIQDDWNKGLLIQTIQKATNNLSQSLSQLKTDSLEHCHSLYDLDDDISQSLESLHGMSSVHSHDKSIQNPLKIIHHFRSFENFLNKINSELSSHQGDFIQNDAQHKNPALCIKAIHESLAATSRELTYLFEWLAQDNEHSLLSNDHKNMVRDLLNKDKKDLNIYSFLETLTNQYETEKNHADGVFSDYNNPYWHLENNIMVSFRSENIPSHRSAGEEINLLPDGQDLDNLHSENNSPRSEDSSFDEAFADEEIDQQDPDNLHLQNSAIVIFRPENIPSHRAAGEEGREITTIDDGQLADYKASIAKTLFAFQKKVPVIQNALSNLHAHLNNIA
jgi:hypothetical protein